MALACLSLGMFLATFSTSRHFALSAILMLPTGFSLITAIVACNTLVQTLVDEDKRSRVMSLYVAASVGGAPTGSLLAGWAASLFGAPLTIAFCGAFVAILGAVLLARHPATLAAVTEIYRKKGFIE
jgi:MFS family permease